jgi:hypothetical protein
MFLGELGEYVGPQQALCDGEDHYFVGMKRRKMNT